MDERELIKSIKNTIKEGSIFENPGSGTSKVKRITEESIAYIRGNSFYVRIK